jgi:hypothetical protein
MTTDEMVPPPRELIDKARAIVLAVRETAHPFDRAVAAYIIRRGDALAWHHLRWVFRTWHAMTRGVR